MNVVTSSTKRAHRWFLWLVVVWLTALGTEAAAEAPQRDGFTLEAGLGLAVTAVAGDGGGTKLGPAPMSLSLGGFLRPNIALLARATGTTTLKDVSGATRHFTHSLLAGALEVWLNRDFVVTGGFGLASYGPTESFVDADGQSVQATSAWGGLARVGYSAANWENHNLRVALEVIPGFYESGTVVGGALTFEYQWF